MKAVTKLPEGDSTNRTEQAGVGRFHLHTVYCETCDRELRGTPGDLGEEIHTFHVGHVLDGIGTNEG